jgi:MFS family permease
VKRSLQTNITAIYLMGFFHSFMVVIPVFVPLLQGYGLSMTQVLQTQALFAMTVALLEVPSGYFADICGRKLAILIGSLFNGAGFLLLLSAQTFFDFLMYEFMLGVGISLISGADLALLYDSGGANRSLSRLISIEAGASGVAGIVASLLLVYSNMEMLLVVQAVAGLMPCVLGLALVETPRPQLQISHSANAREIMRLLLFSKPVVLWTTLAIAVFGLLSMYSFWVYQKYWELASVPISSFGYIWAAFALTVSVAARYAGVLEQRIGWRRLLWLAAALPFVGLLGMALSSGWVGVLFGLAIQITRGLSLTVFYDALNRRVPGDFRATVNSLVSLGVRGIFIVTGPLLGYMLDHHGMQITLIGMACVFAPLFMLVIAGLGSRIRREGGAHQAEPLSAI